MVETVGSLVTLSDATAQLVERTAGSIASVRGGGRWHSSAEFIGGPALSSRPKKSWSVTKTLS